MKNETPKREDRLRLIALFCSFALGGTAQKALTAEAARSAKIMSRLAAVFAEEADFSNSRSSGSGGRSPAFVRVSQIT